MARKIIYLQDPAGAVGEEMSNELKLRIKVASGLTDDIGGDTPGLGVITPDLIKQEIDATRNTYETKMNNDSPWLRNKGEFIDITNKRYKGIGKRLRLKRDLKKNPNSILFTGNALIGHPEDTTSFRDSKRILRNLPGRQYTDNDEYWFPSDGTSRYGVALAQAKEYFSKNPGAYKATYEPTIATQTKPAGGTTPPTQETAPAASGYFTGFGGNTDFLNQSYEGLDEDSKKKITKRLSYFDYNHDGHIDVNELNAFRNANDMGSNINLDEYTDDTIDQNTAQSIFGNRLTIMIGDKPATWINENWKKERLLDSNNKYYIDTKDNDAWKDFLKDTYNVSDEFVNAFGTYSDFLKAIGYTPEKGRETYIDSNVNKRFFDFMKNNYKPGSFIYNNGVLTYRAPQSLKFGGKMNYINFFLSGGAVKRKSSQDELLRNAIYAYIGYGLSQGKKVSVDDAILAVAGVVATEPELLQLLIKQKQLVSSGEQYALQTEPDVVEQLNQDGVPTQAIESAMLSLSSLEQAAAQEALVLAARHGAKLNYIKRLKGECPEGYEMAYYKAGGTVCPVCQKKAEEKRVLSAKCGKKMKKGSISKAMNGIRTEMYQLGGDIEKYKSTRVKIYPEDLDYSKLINLDEYKTIPDNLYITEDIDNTGIVPDTAYILNDRDFEWYKPLNDAMKHMYGYANKEFNDNFEKYKKAFLKAKEDQMYRVLNAGKPPVLHPITSLVIPK